MKVKELINQENEKFEQEMEPIQFLQCGESGVEFKNKPNINVFEDWNPFKNGTSNHVSPLETIIEEESALTNDEDCRSENLVKRLKTLEQEYNELVIYTRDEENILNETTKRVEELEEQLKVAEQTILKLQNQQELMAHKYKMREQELFNRVYKLEEELGSKEDIIDVPYVMGQLLQLQEILSWSPKTILLNKEENPKKNNNEIDKLVQQVEECRIKYQNGNETQDLLQKMQLIYQGNEQSTGVVNKIMERENSSYKSTIVKHQSTINILEEKLKFSELKAQRQKQLLNSAQEQIIDLRKSFAQKERLICNNSKYNEDQLLYFNRCNFCDKTSSDLCKVISYFISEQKALLQVRLPQDQRNHYRSVVKKIKSNNSLLKNVLRNYDFSKIGDVLINSSSNIKEYYNIEKQFLNLQIEQLELSNKAYLYEIIALKDLQDSKKHVGPHHA